MGLQVTQCRPLLPEEVRAADDRLLVNAVGLPLVRNLQTEAGMNKKSGSLVLAPLRLLMQSYSRRRSSLVDGQAFKSRKIAVVVYRNLSDSFLMLWNLCMPFEIKAYLHRQLNRRILCENKK